MAARKIKPSDEKAFIEGESSSPYSKS